MIIAFPDVFVLTTTEDFIRGVSKKKHNLNNLNKTLLKHQKVLFL